MARQRGPRSVSIRMKGCIASSTLRLGGSDCQGLAEIKRVNVSLVVRPGTGTSWAIGRPRRVRTTVPPPLATSSTSSPSLARASSIPILRTFPMVTSSRPLPHLTTLARSGKWGSGNHSREMPEKQISTRFEMIVYSTDLAEET